ncbi:MAG: type II toxin-antitoxin system YafQ family toxin [Eggerthellaceae bacterium]|nr:type II toxin-antitoxin system YafQ family toxin [Eggerthellaceae bacterium]
MRFSRILEIVPSNHFNKDLKLAKKHDYNLGLLDETVNMLQHRQPLPENYREHTLSGEYVGFRECHIQPDWLPIYRIDEADFSLYLFRTGTHADLFD